MCNFLSLTAAETILDKILTQSLSCISFQPLAPLGSPPSLLLQPHPPFFLKYSIHLVYNFFHFDNGLPEFIPVQAARDKRMIMIF
jgi:hypothetical protein